MQSVGARRRNDAAPVPADGSFRFRGLDPQDRPIMILIAADASFGQHVQQAVGALSYITKPLAKLAQHGHRVPDHRSGLIDREALHLFAAQTADDEISSPRREAGTGV